MGKARPSKRDRKRRSQRRAAAVGAERAAKSEGVEARKPRAKIERAMTGLQWLATKNRLSRDQKRAGDEYGQWYRLAVMEGADSLKSCLDVMPTGSGDGVPTFPAGAATWIADGRKKLLEARAAIGFHVGMVAVCDLICGRGFHPREITPTQREAEEIETTLRLALDLIVSHFQEVKREKNGACEKTRTSHTYGSGGNALRRSPAVPVSS